MSKLMVSCAVVAALTMVGCGRGPAEGGADETASLTVKLVRPPNFLGNSVVIKGKRVDRSGGLAKADGKYPCLNEFVECFDFGSMPSVLSGQVPVNDGDDQVEIRDLCPSSDLPKADWQFSYTLYTGHCDASGHPTGDALNPLDHENRNNFACYDRSNLSLLRMPNRSIETLGTGCNENEIICVTENAAKTFDFDVCVKVTPSCLDENGVRVACPIPDPRLLLDCGCAPVVPDASVDLNHTPPAPHCYCPQGLDSPPPGCYFDADCLVACGTVNGGG